LKFLTTRNRLDQGTEVSLTWERVPTVSGSGRVASLLAAKRGVDVELSHAAGALHDFGRFVTGKQANHAENGYGPAKDFLKKVGLFRRRRSKKVCQG